MIVLLKQVEGRDNIKANSLKSILDENNATLIDGSMLPDLARIEVKDQNIAKLKAYLGDNWAVFPEKKYTVPHTKRKVVQ